MRRGRLKARRSGIPRGLAAKVPPSAGAPLLLEVLKRLRRSRGPVKPWRREDPISCLVGTILAQATTDVLADRAFAALRRRFPTWRRVLEAPPAALERTIRFSGLSRQKARAIRSFLRHLLRTRGRLSLDDLRRDGSHRGGLDVDAALKDLSSAHGVGVKTAAITLMFACGSDLCAVDTHLVRILRRLGVVPAKASPERAFRILRPLVPKGRGVELHLQLIRFGRTTCRAQRPRCSDCPLLDLCPHGRSLLAPKTRNRLRAAASPRGSPQRPRTS